MMAADEVIRWIQEEHAKVTKLADRLREMVAVVPRQNMRRWMVDMGERFSHFRAHMIKHMALEERDGFLSVVLEKRPTLSDDVDHLFHEHRELSTLMDGIQEAMNRLGAQDFLLARDCCFRINKLLDYVEHHEELENNLVSYALTQDIGTHD